MSDPWFRPKMVGYGYNPANAKGLIALLIFVAIAATTMTLLGDPVAAKSSQSAAWIVQLRADAGLSGLHLPLAARFALLIAELAVFFAFARWKSRP
ncbi:hypothetical protein [Phenylobacterium sp.]|uniref:hypothetical protein n=1 Tax=Phenylobacterium sp. TaxID=1871053 RepID=UPI0011F5B0B9|nr:hypothetical protein [Phenylobacterium sp.]THD58583.1 MAG: hypothetical protein E8A49_18855 [Phenylobacterium sp.]